MEIKPGVHKLEATLPDLPGKVHGIKQIGEVWAVQCDDCHAVHADTVPVIACGRVTFNTRLAHTEERYLRLCADCWRVRGWTNSVSRGWQAAA